MTKILLVGTGITSALTASILKKEIPHLNLHVWDKARGAGGRMSTSRHRNHPEYSVDLGAQYICATSDYRRQHELYYNELMSEDILSPLTETIGGMRNTAEGTEHYVVPKGSSSIVKHFLNKASPTVQFGYHVNDISVKDGLWEVSTQTGITDTFDVVILTMPVPQILGLTGSVNEMIGNNKSLLDNLKSVEYSSRYAMGLFFDKGQLVQLPTNNTAQYVTNDPVVRFVCIDNKKRGKDDEPASIVVHTSVPYGKAHVDKTTAQMEKPLLEKVNQMFPSWPQPNYVKCQKWRFSQVSSAYPGLPGAVSPAKGLILGGDGFTHSNFDGCVESAEAVVKQVSSFLQAQK